jgi:hypothetical protein
MSAADRVQICTCLTPVPFELDRGVFVCDACSDLLPPPGI